MSECPRCGGEGEFVDIVGDVASPTGATYRCVECSREFDEIGPSDGRESAEASDPTETHHEWGEPTYSEPLPDGIDISDREYPVSDRRHETYEADHWETVHIDAVDHLFVADMGDPDDPDYVSSLAGIGDPERVRIDLDGIGSGGASTHERGDNVQASIWLTPEFAEALYQQLGDLIDDREPGLIGSTEGGV